MSNKYWLSILIPSCRAEGLEKFVASLMTNSLSYNNIQIIILQDGEIESTIFHENTILITRPKDAKLSIPKLQEECYKYALADWIMLANDDITCETKFWDAVVQKTISEFHDGIGIIWPNDNMFGERLACFPIFHRKVFDLVYPLSYGRYKVDDTILQAFPNNRRKYLSEVMFRHDNDKGEVGFKLDETRVYPVDPVIAHEDEELWNEQVVRRYKLRKKIVELIGGEWVKKVMIGISTMEMGRRADFYDWVDLLAKPEGMHSQTKSHGQSPAIARNMIFREAFENNCTHVLLLDDDIAFKPDTLTRLFAHDKEVVCGLQFMRQFPHKPIIFDYFEKNHAHWRLLKDGESGLIPIVAAGLGCVLIRLTLLEDMEQPWVRLGEIQKDNWCDDIGFWLRAQSKDMWCDLDTPIAHYANIALWPNKIDGVWYTSYDSNGTGQAHVPQSKYNANDRANKDTKSEVEGQLR